MGLRSQTYAYMEQLLSLNSQTPLPGHHTLAWPVLLSPIHVAHIIPDLRQHPDSRFADYIIGGLSEGFRIGFSRQTHLRCIPKNHPSSLANPEVVRDRISSELAAGRLIGPLQSSCLQHVQVSPIGLVPKAHSSTQWRMIVDLSFPSGSSVNDGINGEWCSLRYASLDDAGDLIQRLGPGTNLVKMDIKDAYRIVPIHPDDQHLLAIMWERDVFIDRALPFGLRSAPLIFTAVADALAWILYKRGVRFLLHYLDDLLFFGAPSSPEAAQAKHSATQTFAHLGVPIADRKTEGPSTCLVFLGILVDTMAMQLRLPLDKLDRLREMVTGWTTRKSLLGHLAHAATVIQPGRVFLHSMFSLLSVARQQHHFVRLNRIARADLQWWACFLQSWNGVSFFPADNPHIHIYSDASGSFGCGAFDPLSYFFQLAWPTCWSRRSIAAKELLPVVVAAALWGCTWTRKRVRFNCDNLAVVAVLQKRVAKDVILAHLLRCLCFYAAFYQFSFSAAHIPGERNGAADAISRDNVPLFSYSFPQVRQSVVPQHIQDLVLLQPPDWSSPGWIDKFRLSLRIVSPQPQ